MGKCFLRPVWSAIVILSLCALFPGFAQADPTETISLDDSDKDDVMSSAAEKAIAVIEKRPFSKAGRGEIALGIGTIASDIFLVYLPVTIRGAYHFKEWVSLELSASYMGCFSDETGEHQLRAAGQKCMRFVTPSYDNLTTSAGLTQLRSITIEEYQVARVDVAPVFSVFMGKFALANRGIAHFDLNLSAGIGLQVAEVPDSNEIGKINYGISAEGAFGLGMRFVFLNFVGLRLDFREYLYGKQRGKGLGTTSELTLGVSFLLGGSHD